MIELYTKVGTESFKREDPFFRFPAGEFHLKNPDIFVGKEIAYIYGTNPSDYVKAQLWANCVYTRPNVVIPYFPAARADKGYPRGAAIYANLIPDFKKLVTFDVHSSYALSYLSSVRDESQTVVHVKAWEALASKYDSLNYDGIIAPDEGATERAKEVADHYGLPLFLCKKERDFETGNLMGFSVPENYAEMDRNGKYLIVDDICDGGGTFILLAIAFSKMSFNGALDLYVSHGIFSKGLDKLRERFGKIITTNSFYDPDRCHSPLEFIDIKQLLLSKV